MAPFLPSYSREGVVKGCERTFDLKLDGAELAGMLLIPEGTFEVTLRKQ